jgi:hypothetical protein
VRPDVLVDPAFRKDFTKPAAERTYANVRRPAPVSGPPRRHSCPYRGRRVAPRPARRRASPQSSSSTSASPSPRRVPGPLSCAPACTRRRAQLGRRVSRRGEGEHRDDAAGHRGLHGARDHHAPGPCAWIALGVDPPRASKLL